MNAISELMCDVWLWIFLMIITMSIMSILMLYYRKDFQKSLRDLEEALLQEDANINQNFERIHRDLSIIEREINHTSHLAEDFYKQQSGVSSLARTSKPVGKKAKKFLTPMGKIKKQYRDHPLAQKCYEKFHNMQVI